jgi:hypothetical protein
MTLHQEVGLKILRQVNFKLLNVFDKLVNSFLSGAEIAVSHLIKGVRLLITTQLLSSMIFSILEKATLNRTVLTCNYPQILGSSANSKSLSCTAL